jgi:hypothetical protein
MINQSYWGMILAIEIHLFSWSHLRRRARTGDGMSICLEDEAQRPRCFFHIPRYWTLNMGEALDDEFFSLPDMSFW